jgi:hypothetical protein
LTLAANLQSDSSSSKRNFLSTNWNQLTVCPNIPKRMDLSPYVNVVDVYEAASDIGRDLEQLAERYGQESIEKLVPKICIVLEQLEQSVVRGDRDTSCRAELQTVTEQMELQRQERKQTRLRHENVSSFWLTGSVWVGIDFPNYSEMFRLNFKALEERDSTGDGCGILLKILFNCMKGD